MNETTSPSTQHVVVLITPDGDLLIPERSYPFPEQAQEHAEALTERTHNGCVALALPRNVLLEAWGEEWKPRRRCTFPGCDGDAGASPRLCDPCAYATLL